MKNYIPRKIMHVITHSYLEPQFVSVNKGERRWSIPSICGMSLYTHEIYSDMQNEYRTPIDINNLVTTAVINHRK